MPIELRVQERGRSRIGESEFGLLRASAALQSLLRANIISMAVRRGGCEIEAGPYVGSVALEGNVQLHIGEKTPGALAALFRHAYSGSYRLIAEDARYMEADDDGADWLVAPLWRAFLDTAEAYA